MDVQATLGVQYLPHYLLLKVEEDRGIEPLRPLSPAVFKTASSTNRTSSLVLT